MKKSKYSYKIIDNYLLIVDEMTNTDTDIVSVTNNIEIILEEIIQKENVDISDLGVVYRDTLFNWDKITINKFNNKIRSINFSEEMVNQELFDNMYMRS